MSLAPVPYHEGQPRPVPSALSGFIVPPWGAYKKLAVQGRSFEAGPLHSGFAMHTECTLGPIGGGCPIRLRGTFESMHGHVRQLGPGRYLVRISAGRDPVTGKRSQPSRTIHGSRRDAELALAKLRVEHSRCLTPLSDTTLDVLIDQFLSAPTRSGSPQESSFHSIVALPR